MSHYFHTRIFPEWSAVSSPTSPAFGWYASELTGPACTPAPMACTGAVNTSNLVKQGLMSLKRAFCDLHYMPELD